jgi:sugar/nucleoside kinase (ribokinase family)
MGNDYKIAVLGPIPRDHITTHEGLEIRKYGCALYPVVALSSLVSANSKVFAVTHVRKIDETPIREMLGPFQNVDTSHINSDADQGDVISLTYLDQNRRLERQTGFMNPIMPADVADILDADAFVFVPVTDFEIALDTLKYIQENSPGVIIFDAHGPTNACTRRGKRVHRFWIDRDIWLPHIDILKMNLEEAGCCWFRNEYQPEELEQVNELPLDELPKFAVYCLDHGVKAVYITLDEYGCAVYFKDTDGKLQEHFVKRVLVENVVDTTGCGDSFAGGLAFGLLKTGDYVRACQYGNAMGAQRCTGTDLAIYKPLAETEQQISETYGT